MKAFLLITGIIFCGQSLAQLPLYKEQYRPQFHFTTPLHWINDPNGLVYNNNQYHLFYQHNPMGIRWGHMSWGHAVSKDLVHWQHLPLAIEEGKETMIFSGTCVVDKDNTSGFGKPGKIPMVAIYTGHQEGINQSQHLAYSLDEGVSWTKYDKNPVLDLGKKDFRDPKVFWYQPHQKWVMAVVLPIEKQIQLYSSPNLKEWKLMSLFGPAGDTTGIWECPDLFEVPISNEPGKTKWVLMHSPAPYMQYFIGEFDGISFRNENPPAKIFRPDYGPDYYAAIVYNNLPAGKDPVSIGWVNNWNYANDIPTMPWRGAMSLPRNLSVKKINSEWILLQRPVTGLKNLRTGQRQWNNLLVEGTKRLPVTGQQYEIELLLDISNSDDCGIQLAAGGGHEIEIGYDVRTKKLYIDRSKTAHQSFHKNFEKLSRFGTPLILTANQLRLHIFFDNSIVEVFANNGEAALTAQLYPQTSDNAIQLFSRKGKAIAKEIRFWKIKSASQ